MRIIGNKKPEDWAQSVAMGEAYSTLLILSYDYLQLYIHYLYRSTKFIDHVVKDARPDARNIKTIDTNRHIIDDEVYNIRDNDSFNRDLYTRNSTKYNIIASTNRDNRDCPLSNLPP